MGASHGVANVVRVERPEDLRDALQAALGAPAPSLVEIVVA